MEIDGVEFAKVASVGAGVIGYSYALKFAMAGLEVWAQNRTEESSELARQRVATSLDSLVKNGVYTADEAGEIAARIHYTTSIAEAVTGAQFIQESSAEHYEVKWELVKAVEAASEPDAIIASSTSGLLVTEIAKNAEHPERFCGKAFYTAIGMEPVVLQKEALGFICNRLQMALYREVANLVLSGVCTIEDADKAVTFGPGIRWGIMGPSLVFELGGGKGGVSGLMNHLNDSINLWLEDMADWKSFPPEFAQVAQDGVNDELAARPAETGNTPEGLAEYRDHMLIELLKLHKKL